MTMTCSHSLYFELAFKPTTMKMAKGCFFLVVAVLVVSVISSKQVSGTGMCDLSYEQTFKQSKTSLSN